MEEYTVIITQFSYVDDILANVITINLTFEDAAQLTDYLVKKAKDAQEALKAENASKENKSLWNEEKIKKLREEHDKSKEEK